MSPRRTKERLAQNSGPEQPMRKPRGKPFTGKDDPRRNNGGVPPEARELKAALMHHGPELIQRFMKLARKGNALAIVRGLEHVVGKPTQAVELTGKDGGPVEVNAPGVDLRKLTHEQLLQLDAILEAAGTEAGGSPSGAGAEESAPVRP